MTGERDTERTKATIRRWGERVWTRGDLTATPDLIAPGFVCHRAGGLEEIRGHEGHDRWVAEARERNPGLRVEILALVADGETVASFWRGTGTGIHFYRMEGGKIAEMWTVVEEAGS